MIGFSSLHFKVIYCGFYGEILSNMFSATEIEIIIRNVDIQLLHYWTHELQIICSKVKNSITYTFSNEYNIYHQNRLLPTNILLQYNMLCLDVLFVWLKKLKNILVSKAFCSGKILISSVSYIKLHSVGPQNLVSLNSRIHNHGGKD
jgi:hypothetical protein